MWSITQTKDSALKLWLLKLEVVEKQNGLFLSSRFLLYTCTRCLKSENPFISPRFRTLAVIKKHSQINGYLAEPPKLLPELLASWDCSNRFSPSLLVPLTSPFPGLFFINHSATSSDEACKAVNSLKKIVL